MNIAYLQCDLRYNNKLLKKIAERYVIEHTIDRIRAIDHKKIVAGIYACENNKPLVEVLINNGVEVVLSEDDNVNSRFINLMIEENADYVIRIGGDQVLLDNERVNTIIKDMHKQNMDFFYEPSSASVLPDIVSIECLKIHRKDSIKENRYFMALEKDLSVRRYLLPYFDVLLYDFRANSNEGYRVCKNVIEKNLNIYDLTKKLAVRLNDRNNYLNKTGIWGSWILADVSNDFYMDEEEMVNPWIGRSIVDLIRKKLNKNLKVFEWGSGNSTLFWSQYVGEVVSIEYDMIWFKKMKDIVPQNVKLQYCELEYNGEYCRKINDEEDMFDIILVDGRDRVRCAQNSLQNLKENGVIIWDNSEREYYQGGFELLKKQGFKQIELSSIVYGLPGMEEFTSIFYRDNNVLGL